MNIFAVDKDPQIAARSLCNKHIIKMPTESAQMLYYCFHPSKSNHYNHPAAIWARTSLENFEWLLDHAFELCCQYKLRYKREHASFQTINWCFLNKYKLILPQIGLTSFARCFGDYKSFLEPVEDTIKAYRIYYRMGKRKFAKWHDLDCIPDWWLLNNRKNYVDKSFVNGVYLFR